MEKLFGRVGFELGLGEWDEFSHRK